MYVNMQCRERQMWMYIGCIGGEREREQKLYVEIVHMDILTNTHPLSLSHTLSLSSSHSHTHTRMNEQVDVFLASFKTQTLNPKSKTPNSEP